MSSTESRLRWPTGNPIAQGGSGRRGASLGIETATGRAARRVRNSVGGFRSIAAAGLVPRYQGERRPNVDLRPRRRPNSISRTYAHCATARAAPTSLSARCAKSRSHIPSPNFVELKFALIELAAAALAGLVSRGNDQRSILDCVLTGVNWMQERGQASFFGERARAKSARHGAIVERVGTSPVAEAYTVGGRTHQSRALPAAPKNEPRRLVSSQCGRCM